MINNIVKQVILAFCVSQMIFPAIWVVSNTGDLNADFTSLQDGHNGAAADDTLYVMGSPDSYATCNLSKPLTIIGPGYFLDENPETQVDPNPATTGRFEFRSGSAGSYVTGLNIINTYVIYDAIEINTDDITIKRNYIENANSGPYYSVDIKSESDNPVISQNFIVRNGSGGQTAIGVASDCINATIRNNYIYSVGASIITNLTSTSVIEKNLLLGSIDAHYAMIQDNIHYSGDYTGSNNLVYNNISHADYFGSENGNIGDIPMDSGVFIGTGSTDGQWQLTAGSPAEGAGYDGDDCGMYGGLAPYVLSGMPNIPTIFSFEAPAIVPFNSETMQIQIQAKSHNEE